MQEIIERIIYAYQYGNHRGQGEKEILKEWTLSIIEEAAEIGYQYEQQDRGGVASAIREKVKKQIV